MLYTSSSPGLYINAFHPNGSVKWTHNVTQSFGYTSPGISIDFDTKSTTFVYYGGQNSLNALHATNGSLAWQILDTYDTMLTVGMMQVQSPNCSLVPDCVRKLRPTYQNVCPSYLIWPTGNFGGCLVPVSLLTSAAAVSDQKTSSATVVISARSPWNITNSGLTYSIEIVAHPEDTRYTFLPPTGFPNQRNASIVITPNNVKCTSYQFVVTLTHRSEGYALFTETLVTNPVFIAPVPPPVILEQTAVHQGSVILTWTPPDTNGTCPVVSYSVTSEPPGFSTVVAEDAITNVTIPVKPGNYRFKIVASSSVGFSEAVISTEVNIINPNAEASGINIAGVVIAVIAVVIIMALQCWGRRKQTLPKYEHYGNI